jgi:hypothetical protein
VLNLKRYLLIFFLLCLILLGGAGLYLLNSQPPAEEIAAQDTAVAVPGTPRASPAVFTPFPTSENFISPTPADQEYDLIVSGAYFIEPDDDAALLPPEGEKWYVVQASIFNMGGYDVEILPETLYLRMTTGESYAASEPNEITDPSLIGLSLSAGESEIGFFHFVIPVESTPMQLFWCPRDDDCNSPIYTEIPVHDVNSSEG